MIGSSVGTPSPPPPPPLSLQISCQTRLPRRLPPRRHLASKPRYAQARARRHLPQPSVPPEAVRRSERPGWMDCGSSSARDSSQSCPFPDLRLNTAVTRRDAEGSDGWGGGGGIILNYGTFSVIGLYALDLFLQHICTVE